MLYLLNKDVKTVRWNGEPLHEATSAIVKETMNGDFTLTVKYPISDSGIYQLIQEDMLIKAPTPVLGAQLFRIKKPVEHNDHLEITAYHISDDVMQRSITPMSVTSQSCGMALSRMVQNTKTALGDFSFNSDIQDRRTFNTTETETLYSVLLDGKHSIVGTWEGELVRDNFALTVKKSRGENRGVVITTHKNLKDYQRTRNSQNVVTRIHAKSTFKPEGSEKETTFRVTVDSPLINSYPYINEKEYENNNAKSVEELQKWAQAKFSNEGIDKVSDAIKIEAYELDGQVVHMGDTVNLKSWKHNVDEFKKAIAYEFDALKEEYISLTFDDKASTGGSRASGGLSNAVDAILGVTGTAQEIALEKALQNADLDFDHQAGLLRQEILDGIELARAKAEEVKRELSDTINQRFDNFDNASIQEAKRRAEEALRNAGASSLLAQEAKRISLDSIAKLEAFKSQATSAQTALSGDLDALKRTVTSEVNQASEYRRTTTDALSRMTGQMNGFATKSEVRQDVAGLTETFAKLKTDTNNLISGAKSEITLAKTEFKKTADGLSAKMSAVESYVGQDGQRQEALRRYTREESARQATAVRELVTRDYVGKSTYQEDVRGLERRFSAISTQTNNDIASKIAQYKQTVDGQFSSITSQISGKVNQTDFQHVRETSQLYERIIGSNENDISNKVARMALTNQLFQVEVAKNIGSDNNLIVRSKSMDRHTLVNEGNTKRVFVNNGIFSIRCTGNSGYTFAGFTLPLYIDRMARGETYTLNFKYRIMGRLDHNFTVVAKNHRANDTSFSSNIATSSTAVSNNWQEFNETYTISRDFDFGNSDIYPLYFYLAKNGWVEIKEIMLVRASQTNGYKASQFDDMSEAVRSVQSQLAGSWSVQNINSAGDLISGLNLGANGHNRLSGKLTHITGETLIERAVIKSAMIDKLKTANFEAGSVTTVVLDAEAVTAEKIKVDQALFNKLVANEAYLSQLFAKQAFINRVQSVAIDASQVRSGILSGDRIYGGTIRGANIFGGTLTGHTKIQLGSYGSFDTVNGGLQINVPRDYNAKDGLGVQFIGSYGRGENVPYGLFIYKDSDFTTGGYASRSDDFLLTVEGYIKANGIGWFKTGKGSINGSSTATIGYWNSSVSMDFGGSGNDIYYSYNGKAYSLWTIVNKHFSDRRLKENIVECKHKALDYIQQFQFKEYDWKKQEDRPRQAHTKIGLIAQEVQAVDPTLVYENGDTLNLDNLRLTNIALKAIQELALENQKLTHRLENLENERRTA
ncbi:phage tail spike protein [uncultured Streptococcus sp.]|uniref:phage tail spike protein n=1 Tax=uncultured Streptococcus sp. TaxID=83427 RepID=UPI0025D3A4DE|nr:phage tail spike protein [uncultured Streptococcus sp.]MDU1740110.1 phage tail spike protein [Streptococcus mitis]